LLLDVLKAHSLVRKILANMSVVSSYLSTKAGEVKDQSYYFNNNAFRDLIKAQNNKANKIEALIEIGDLRDENFQDLGLKGLHYINTIKTKDKLFTTELSQKPMDLRKLDQAAQRDLKKKQGTLLVLQR
jgi:biotin synthase-like enzyme